jgi:hypothetical protein
MKLGVGNTIQIGRRADDSLHIRKFSPNREVPAGWVFFVKRKQSHPSGCHTSYKQNNRNQRREKT